MAKIRADLVGVVAVEDLTLYPGDEVPDGVIVGDHVLELGDSGEDDKEPAEPKRSASRARKS